MRRQMVVSQKIRLSKSGKDYMDIVDTKDGLTMETQVNRPPYGILPTSNFEAGRVLLTRQGWERLRSAVEEAMKAINNGDTEGKEE